MCVVNLYMHVMRTLTNVHVILSGPATYADDSTLHLLGYLLVATTDLGWLKNLNLTLKKLWIEEGICLLLLMLEDVT